MQSIGLSRGFFGCTHSSLLTAAMVVGTLVLAGKVSAQDQPSPSKPASMPESHTMATHAGAPISLRDLVQEAEQKNPQIAASMRNPMRRVRNITRIRRAFRISSTTGASKRVNRYRPTPMRSSQ